jgi:hypothetical protein
MLQSDEGLKPVRNHVAERRPPGAFVVAGREGDETIRGGLARAIEGHEGRDVLGALSVAPALDVADLAFGAVEHCCGGGHRLLCGDAVGPQLAAEQPSQRGRRGVRFQKILLVRGLSV